MSVSSDVRAVAISVVIMKLTTLPIRTVSSRVTVEFESPLPVVFSDCRNEL